MTTGSARSRLLVALAVSAVLLLTGCVGMPAEGPVVVTPRTGIVEDERATAIDPLPPQPGASSIQVAEGFLRAMTATPIRTSVAAQYLAEDARTGWKPDEATIIYADTRPARAVAGGAVVPLVSAERLDGRGAWVGDVSQRASALRLEMIREDGELRIADPPDALVVPATWFEQRFRAVSLFFFDRTGQILVPEPVFVPRGEQLASTLTAGLLAGPPSRPAEVVRSFIPDGLSVGLSVPIDDDGVAEIDFAGDPSPRTSEANALMLAQLAWTLRQDPAIQALRVSIGGEPIFAADDTTEFRVDAGATYSPTGYQASTLLYGLDRTGLLVSGSPDNLGRVSGPLGRERLGLRSVAVDLRGAVAVGIGADGTSAVRAPVREDDTPQRAETIVSDAVDLLPPAWDHLGRLWLVDRTNRGARVLHVDGSGGAPRILDVPGVTGRDVRGFLVSRDATRLVAIVRRPRTDRMVSARVIVGRQGRVRRAVQATTITPEEGSEVRVSDLAWATPTSVSLLSPVRPGLSEVREIPVDGAPSDLSVLSTTVLGPVRSLAGTPAPDEATYALGGSVLLGVVDGGVVDPGVALRTVTYVG